MIFLWVDHQIISHHELLKMADDWDLFAVVRSCTNSTATATTTAASTTSSNPGRVRNRELGDPFVNLPSFEHDGDPFYFPGVIDERDDSFQGLEEIYKELYLDSAAPGEFHRIQPPHHQQVHPHVQPQQQSQHLPLRHEILGTSLSFPSTNPQPARPRRRKNQQAKVTHHMTQEELSTDSWAWRKYGQKPIKGSPYPRNYYRCSTSKGCSARKQVERSPADPDIFVVSYSGEHTHPRPTHRSSLAGSTRSKLSPAAATKPPKSMTALITTTTSSSSPVSATCRPMMEEEGESEGDENNRDEGPCLENDDNPAEMSSGNIIEEDEEGNDEEEDEEEDILIPNSFITDDILKGFQELSGGGTNGSDSSGAVADNS